MNKRKIINKRMYELFYKIYEKIGKPNNGWEKYSQIQYPWYTDETRIWLIGCEPYGWGSEEHSYSLEPCDIQFLENLTNDFMKNKSRNEVRNRSFFNLYYQIIDNDDAKRRLLGYWNYYPFGKRNTSGPIPSEGSSKLFNECNWRNIFWEIMKITEPELIVFCGAYIRNWCPSENFTGEDKSQIVKGEIMEYEGLHIVNIYHPSAPKKDHEIENFVIGIAKNHLL